MKIKKLDITGFKSFVDRTVLHFDHDVLGVVGPNGCGKSNIVDAIRWCMGEQSARHLRGRQMDDVIFAGSDSRAPHDFAEVTLTFDNDTSEALPVEYRDYAEIAVTRRLHRTGESEYLINKTPVRLRDVTDLFLGTGAGTKAYSIVEQGKVGLIVSAKPEDRRLLIEEAAGITKFKGRKRHAERKMELTQQNLLRVGDIVAEIDRGLASLKRQAAKAERYVTYRGELEDLQLHDASHQYLELSGYIKLETGEVDRVARAVDDSRQHLAQREGVLDATRAEAHAREVRVEVAQSETFGAESGVSAEQASIERARDRLTGLTQRRQQMENERLEIAAQAAQLGAERGHVVAEIRTCSQLEAEQLAVMAREEASLQEADREHSNAEAFVMERRNMISTARADLASGRARLGGIERRQSEMEARAAKLSAERASLHQGRVEMALQVTELERSVDRHRGAAREVEAEKLRLEGRLTELKERIREQECEIDAGKAALANARSRCAALHEMRERLEGVGAGTKAIMGLRDDCVMGIVADRVEAPADFTQALAGLLGARLQDVVVQDMGRGMEMLEDLARTRKGRAVLVPHRAAFTAGVESGPIADQADAVRLVDQLLFAPEDEALVRRLVGDAIVVSDMVAARRLREAGTRSALVTYGGTVLHADGRLEGGQGDELSAGMLEGRREARELASEIQRLDAEVKSLIATLDASRVNIGQVGRALDLARQEAHAHDIAALTSEKDLQKNAGQLESMARRLCELQGEEGELVAALDETRFEREGVLLAIDNAGVGLAAAETELRHGEASLDLTRLRRDKQREALLAVKVAVASMAAKLAAARAADARLARSVCELEDRLSRLAEDLQTSTVSYEETVDQLAVHEATLLRCIERARLAREELEAVRAAAESLRSELGAQERDLKDCRSKLDEIRDELQVHEIVLREKRIALEHLVSWAADKFRGLQLPSVVSEYHMRPCPDGVLRTRVEELLRLIDRMGSVNLDAMRELSEAEERFAYYTTQKADLEKALSDLQRAIHQMNRESRRLFEETFSAVNARFQEIFPRMFRGGRAELRMTNPDDLLETGIDIVAQPPGKKLSSIELMSGGEKALTAVSLIFAIFQIKPSPFCILDEVDAPLDDANVARYNETVRSMTDQSQFILITHHKRTMQMVDVLYGVTMPEAGVSKIVSVRISEGLRRTSPLEADAAVA